MSDILIQHIVIRRDILTLPKWNRGSIIAQGAHAALAAVAKHMHRSETHAYLQNHMSMTKAVLGVEDEAELLSLSEVLTKANVPHHLWIEQPDNIPTALATAPQLKSEVKPHLGHLKLLK